jgi:chromosomal replication initiation ATPase DnaA
VIRAADWPADLDARVAAEIATMKPRRPMQRTIEVLRACAEARRAAMTAPEVSYADRIQSVLEGSAYSAGVPVEKMLDSGAKRCGKVTEARRIAARRLKDEVGLSIREITVALGLATHTSVQYLLGWRRKQRTEGGKP